MAARKKRASSKPKKRVRPQSEPLKKKKRALPQSKKSRPSRKPQKVKASFRSKKPKARKPSAPKRVNAARKKPTPRRPSIQERIRAAAPLFSAFIQETQKVRELERKLAEAERSRDEEAERAAIVAESALPELDEGDALRTALEWLRQDSSPARHKSILRHMLEADEWRRELQLVGQGDPDSPLFRSIAKRIALEAGVSVREVYTLWWSP
jgi:hypothetical protein